MDLRLCDDAGNVAGHYMGVLNRLRRMSSREPFLGEPFPCTGSANLAGERIRCTSPAHEIEDERTPWVVQLGGGGEPEEALGGDLGRGNPTRSTRAQRSSSITSSADPGDECDCGGCT